MPYVTTTMSAFGDNVRATSANAQSTSYSDGKRANNYVFQTLCYKPQKWSGIEPLHFCIAHSGCFYVAFTAPQPARFALPTQPIAPGAHCGRLSPCSGTGVPPFSPLRATGASHPFFGFATSATNDGHNTTCRDKGLLRVVL